MKWEYKETHPFGRFEGFTVIFVRWFNVFSGYCSLIDQRLNESTKIREKYPERIPVSSVACCHCRGMCVGGMVDARAQLERGRKNGPF